DFFATAPVPMPAPEPTSEGVEEPATGTPPPNPLPDAIPEGENPLPALTLSADISALGLAAQPMIISALVSGSEVAAAPTNGAGPASQEAGPRGGVATPQPDRREEAKSKIQELIAKHQVQVIALGNGPGCRETEEFLAELLTGLPEL